jgi:putative ABC transport system permease protein
MIFKNVLRTIQQKPLLSATFSSLLLVMCVVVIVLILKKRINADRMQIGVLKAMGYSRLTISLNYLTYPLIAATLSS